MLLSSDRPIHRYKFTEQERDSESGNDYFGARYYSSNMGRFMSPDPSGLAYADLTNPQSLNLYSYAQNSPIIFRDPSGLCSTGDSSDCEGDPRTNEGDEGSTFSGGSGLNGGAVCTPCNWIGGLFSGWSFGEPNASDLQSDGIEGFNFMSGAMAQQQGSTPGCDPKAHCADLNSPEIKELLNPNHKPSPKDKIGSGECVAACRHFSGLPDHTQWKPGPAVVGNNITPGTAIATFDKDGKFVGNSAIYLGPGVLGGPNSIRILDQFNHPPNPPQPRDLRFNANPNYDPSNNANSYHVIYLR